jgi:hypothetical protein
MEVSVSLPWLVQFDRESRISQVKAIDARMTRQKSHSPGKSLEQTAFQSKKGPLFHDLCNRGREMTMIFATFMLPFINAAAKEERGGDWSDEPVRPF